jgi:cell division protein FtsW (lipid II flippase)
MIALRALGALSWLFAFCMLILFLILGGVWHRLYAVRMASLPPVSQADEIRITSSALPGGAGVVMIGRDGLGQNLLSDSAEVAHLAVIFSGGAPVALANSAQSRNLLLRYAQGEVGSRRVFLQTGDRLLIGDREIRVTAANAGALTLDFGTATQNLPQPYYPEGGPNNDPALLANALDIGGVVRDAPDVSPGPPGAVDRLKRFIRSLMHREEILARVVPLPPLPARALRISRFKEAGHTLEVRTPLLVRHCPARGRCAIVGRQAWALSDARLGALKGLVIGRTSYDLAVEGDALVLRPTDRAHWLTEARRATLGPVEAGVTTVWSAPQMRGLPEGSSEEGPPQLADLLRHLAGGFGWPSLGLAVLWLLTGAGRDHAESKVGGHRYPLGTMARMALVLQVCLVVTVFLPQAPPEIFAKAGALRGRDLAATPEALLTLVFIGVNLAYLVPFLGGLVRWGLRGLTMRRASYQARDAISAARDAPLTAAVRWRAGAALAAVGGGVFVFVGLPTLPPVSATGAAAWAGAAYGAIGAVIAMYTLTGLALSLRQHAVLAPLLWLSLTVVVAIGTLSISQLVLGHHFARFVQLYERHLLFTALIAMMAGQFALQRPERVFFLLRSTVRRVTNPRFGGKVIRLFLFLVTLGLGFLLWQAPEGGIWNLQPSELGKTWLALLLAVLLAVWFERNAMRLSFERRASLLAVLLTFLLVFALFAVGSAINADLSPIFILLVMMLVVGCAFAFVALLQVLGTATAAVIGGGVFLWLYRGGLVSTATLPVVVLALAPIMLVVGRQRTGKAPVTLELLRSPWYEPPQAIQARRNIWKTRARRLARWTVARPARLLCGLALVVAAFLGISRLSEDFIALGDMQTLESYRATLGPLALPQTVQERFLSFQDAALDRATVDPAPLVRHPDLSLQVRESREVIAASGCGFLESVAEAMANEFGGLVPAALQLPAWPRADTTLCAGPGLIAQDAELPEFVLYVPAIQDDFGAAALVATRGRDAALVLMVAQLGLVAVIWAIAGSCMTLGFQRIVNRSTVAVGGIFLFNGGVILLAQFLLAWANAFGLLPVVGQPMTFLSLAGSHHLFFALPLVGAALLFSIIGSLADVALPQRAGIEGIDFRRRHPFAFPSRVGV